MKLAQHRTTGWLRSWHSVSSSSKPRKSTLPSPCLHSLQHKISNPGPVEVLPWTTPSQPSEQPATADCSQALLVPTSKLAKATPEWQNPGPQTAGPEELLSAWCTPAATPRTSTLLTKQHDTPLTFNRIAFSWVFLKLEVWSLSISELSYGACCAHVPPAHACWCSKTELWDISPECAATQQHFHYLLLQQQLLIMQNGPSRNNYV